MGDSKFNKMHISDFSSRIQGKQFYTPWRIKILRKILLSYHATHRNLDTHKIACKNGRRPTFNLQTSTKISSINPKKSPNAKFLHKRQFAARNYISAK